MEKIGEIESASFNFKATGENEGELVFDLKGSKQNGQLFVREQQGRSFGAARLVVNGEEFELGASAPISESRATRRNATVPSCVQHWVRLSR